MQTHRFGKIEHLLPLLFNSPFQWRQMCSACLAWCRNLFWILLAVGPPAWCTSLKSYCASGWEEQRDWRYRHPLLCTTSDQEGWCIIEKWTCKFCSDIKPDLATSQLDNCHNRYFFDWACLRGLGGEHPLPFHVRVPGYPLHSYYPLLCFRSLACHAERFSASKLAIAVKGPQCFGACRSQSSI